MALTMRPTGLGSGIDKDRPDYGVYSGECRPHLPDARRTRQFALVLVDERRRADDALRSRGLEEAKAQFQKSWDAWKAWAKLEEAG